MAFEGQKFMFKYLQLVLERVNFFFFTKLILDPNVYMPNFIPKISHYMNCLAKLLKKTLHNGAHFILIKKLKPFADKLPTQQIQESGKRIL